MKIVATIIILEEPWRRAYVPPVFKQRDVTQDYPPVVQMIPDSAIVSVKVTH